MSTQLTPCLSGTRLGTSGSLTRVRPPWFRTKVREGTSTEKLTYVHTPTETKVPPVPVTWEVRNYDDNGGMGRDLPYSHT